ncbi:MAG: orotate phosphoribosyltransferase [Deferribacteraceae bacterium]|jgi:orotate phosphoribosyltransferase|nr:orotate phosphoribosyltransferase [Deferribacteraceae bacterium]
MTSQEITDTYIRMGGLLKGHFLLSSGLHSDTYLQSEKVMMFPDVAAQIVLPLVNKLKDVEAATIISPAIGGIRFGYELARQLNKCSLFTERVDGIMDLRRGFKLTPGEKVIIAEDVVTTGKSTKECMDVIMRYGGIAAAVACIIDRSGGNAEFDLPFIPLVKIGVQSWTAEGCPICKTGDKPVKPGSRKETD